MLEREVLKRVKLRGEVLLFIMGNHDNQMSRVDDIELWSFLQILHGGISQNDVLTVVQDLCERKYLRFTEARNNRTGELRLNNIMLTPEGRDLCERTEKDPAVLIP